MKSLDKLGIDDDAFLVSSLIDRCPRVMMLRELFQNAVEAAQLSTGKRLIRIGAAEVDGVRKLRIWNTGPGMDPDALFRMGEISSSINKEKALDRNFGIGAKVACLPSNHLGVRYRSCANGRVNEMILGKRGGVYGRLLLRSPGRGSETSVSAIRDVIDVTDIAVAESQPLTEDWTEAVLLGMRPDQDTVLDPYDGKPAVERYWIPETLYHRYARIPGDLQVIINEPLHWAVGERPFVPILARALNEFAGYEAVRSPEGVTVHFLHDPAHPQRRWENASSEDAIQTSMTFVAVMWRNEFYDLRSGSPWYYEAPMFGVTHGGRHVSVIVELPDDYEVLPDMYRQYLLYNAERQDQVRVAEFAGLVRRVRPSWIQGIVQPQDSGGAGVEMLVPELSTLAAALRLDELPIVSRDAAETDATESEPGDAFEKKRQTYAKLRRACGVEPVLLRDPQDIRDRWLEERAARFFPETKQLFVNMCYKSIPRFAQKLEDALTREVDDEMIKQVALNVAEVQFVRRVTRAVLFGLSKHLEPNNWQSGHIEKAISPEALSLVVEDLDDLLPPALLLARDFISEMRAAV